LHTCHVTVITALALRSYSSRMPTIITEADFIQSIADALQHISYYHPLDYIHALADAYDKEQGPAAKDAIAQILTNSRMCAEGHRPICQDTGIVVVFLQVGMNVRWDTTLSVQELVNEGVRRAYLLPENVLRASIVADPAFSRRNTRDNTPAVVHVEMVPGDTVEVKLAAKGGGSENKSKFAMLDPSDSIVDWVMKTVPTMGAGWCPPGMLGIGIGGTAEKAMLMAKESLMEHIDMAQLKLRGPQNKIEELRIELCDKVNALGIGAQGLGGLSTVLDVKIFDNDGSAVVDGDITPDAAAVATGLDRVLEALPSLPVKVVNLGVSVPDDPGVREKINQLWKRGVVTVTVAGDRADAQLDPLLESFASFAGGENVAAVVFPAAYDEPQPGRPAGRGLPLAATTTLGGYPDSTEVTDFILQSTQIDLAVPTSGAPSYTLAGSSCSLREPSSRWAAAEVSGILAALASAYPTARPAQLVTRLLNTTDGRADVPTALTGAGTAQPYEALTRPLRIDRRGDYDQTVPVQTQQQAEAPVVQTDPLVSTREDMVWFGLVGGGVLVLALVLRPVLARRRPG